MINIAMEILLHISFNIGDKQLITVSIFSVVPNTGPIAVPPLATVAATPAIINTAASAIVMPVTMPSFLYSEVVRSVSLFNASPIRLITARSFIVEFLSLYELSCPLAPIVISFDKVVIPLE